MCHPGLDPGSSAQGWQSPFATETGGLFQTGNSVASAEQTSAAQYRTNPRQSASFSAYICVNPLTRDPVSRGGKVRLPQRPEVSPKQATPLPLPNRLRQPLIWQPEGGNVQAKSKVSGKDLLSSYSISSKSAASASGSGIVAAKSSRGCQSGCSAMGSSAMVSSILVPMAPFSTIRRKVAMALA
jgi:hypothetical protein